MWEAAASFFWLILQPGYWLTLPLWFVLMSHWQRRPPVHLKIKAQPFTHHLASSCTCSRCSLLVLETFRPSLLCSFFHTIVTVKAVKLLLIFSGIFTLNGKNRSRSKIGVFDRNTQFNQTTLDFKCVSEHLESETFLLRCSFISCKQTRR